MGDTLTSVLRTNVIYKKSPPGGQVEHKPISLLTTLHSSLLPLLLISYSQLSIGGPFQGAAPGLGFLHIPDRDTKLAACLLQPEDLSTQEANVRYYHSIHL